MEGVRMTSVARKALNPVVLAGAALLVLPFVVVGIGGDLVLSTQIVCFSLIAITFNLMFGYTGLLSFGHALFVGMGAYAAALAQIHLFSHSTILPLVAGTLFAGVLGLAIGALILRRRGVYFSLLTLASAQIGFYLVYRSTHLTGGENGMGGFGPTTLLGLDLSNRVTYYFFTATLVWLSMVVLWRFVHSPFGQILKAIREDEQRVRALGYNTYRVKLVAFTVSALVAGLAGVLYAYLLFFVFPQMIDATFSGQIVAMSVLGGVGSFFGPTVGAAFFVLARELLSDLTSHWVIYFGAAFMAVILFSPQGISGLLVDLWRRGTRRGGRAPAQARERPREEALAAVGPTPSGNGRGNDQPARGRREQRDLGDEILTAEGVVKRFGAFAAVDGASLRVREGSIHGLIGPNGAGKTTFFNCLNGILPITEGKVSYRDTVISGKPSNKITRLGIARSFQIVSLFGELTLFENVRVAVQAVSKQKHSLFTRADAHEDINEEARRLIREMGLEGREELPANTLSHGEQRLLDITMALATKPQMLLLDEPFAGLPSDQRDEIGEVVLSLNQDRGLTVLLIEHDIERVLELSDSITVLAEGKVLAEGTPDEIQANPDVQRAYVGDEHVETAERRDRSGAPTLLELDGVDAFYAASQALEGVSLHVQEGEVVCLLGRNGAGKTTTLSTVMNVVPPAHGRVMLGDQDITRWPIERASAAGVGIVPQGRRIFENLTARENLMLARRAAKEGVTAPWDLDRVYETFPPLKQLQNRKAGKLSGGERQMLAIARALVGNTRVLLMDEPLEGLAEVVVHDIVRLIRELREELTILLVEQNAELALSLADRAYVITSGQIVHEGAPDELLHDESLRNRLVGV
jgi:branched-chain amino acid transport system ATP-binding protein